MYLAKLSSTEKEITRAISLERSPKHCAETFMNGRELLKSRYPDTEQALRNVKRVRCTRRAQAAETLMTGWKDMTSS